MPETAPLPPAPRILISRLSAVGDCIHTLPVLAALRREYPRAFIAWATQHGPASLLLGNRLLDAIIPIERSWWASWETVGRLRRQLQAQQFDVCIDAQCLFKSSLLGWLSGAPLRIGFTRPQGRELSPLLNNCLVRPDREHVVNRYLELLRPLGVHQPEVHFEIPEFALAQESVDKYLRSARLSAGFALLNPGAGWMSKTWPADRYAQVAQHLGARHNLPSVVVWAGAQEKAWAEQIVARSAGHAWLAPATTLRELACLSRRCRFFLGSDTGPTHLAVAVGTRCVALYGPTSPSRCGPYGPGHVVLRKSGYSPQRNRCRRSTIGSMQQIGVPEVIQACEQLMDQIGLDSSAA